MQSMQVMQILQSCTKLTIGELRSVISEHMLRIKFRSTSCEIAPRWIPHNLFDDRSILIQVMTRRGQEKLLSKPVLTKVNVTKGVTQEVKNSNLDFVIITKDVSSYYVWVNRNMSTFLHFESI